MVRIIDGIPIHPIIIFSGWILAVIILVILLRLSPKFNNSDLAEYATLGAFVFFLQSIPLPIKIIPVLLTLSGVPLVITIKGVHRGLLIASSAIILNHLFIPGAISMLGLNLTNMLLAGLVAGLIPSIIYRRMGRRIRYMSGFIGGLVYFSVITLLIVIEFSFSLETNTVIDTEVLLQILALFIVVIGSLEGLVTAIGSSYYHRAKHGKIRSQPSPSTVNTEEDDDLELIDFMDEGE